VEQIPPKGVLYFMGLDLARSPSRTVVAWDGDLWDSVAVRPMPNGASLVVMDSRARTERVGRAWMPMRKAVVLTRDNIVSLADVPDDLRRTE
jgi:hypothetical protein